MQLGILTAPVCDATRHSPRRCRLTLFASNLQPDHDRVGGGIEAVISQPGLDMLRGDPRGF
jgi:hypothetical protein